MRYFNYSGTLSHMAHKVLQPKSERELVRLVADAIADGGRLTQRGGGNSLHDQALGDHMLLFDKLPHRIRIVVDDKLTRDGLRWHTLEVSGWTPWEAPMRAALQLPKPARWTGSWRVKRRTSGDPGGGRSRCWWESETAQLPLLVPYVSATSGRITPGGSLSADTLSRFSPIYGKEANTVIWLDLLTTQEDKNGPIIYRLLNPEAKLFGRLHKAQKKPARVRYAPDQARNDKWFYATIGGFGLCGVILRAKYLLLQLDPQLTPSSFSLHRPAAVVDVSDDDVAAAIIPQDLPLVFNAPKWPAHPHAAGNDLEAGRDAEVHALTWMWSTSGPRQMVETVIDHLAGFDATTPWQLPRKVERDEVGCFGFFFPNHDDESRSVVANTALGRRNNKTRLNIWRREYSWKNFWLVLMGLPGSAALGESIAYFQFHQGIRATARGRPRANAIADFSFFMEGHSIAISGRDPKPLSVQQTWVFPIDHDTATFVADFLRMVWAECQKKPTPETPAIRVLICDVIALPKGRAMLCSNLKTEAVAVTVAVEDVLDYDEPEWADPREVFKQWTTELVSRGARIHLTKNIWAHKADLKTMYQRQARAFRRVKKQLDPAGTWTSRFFEKTLPR